MSSRASSSLARRPDDTAFALADAALLTAANINPATGLATDYLNHFNEAVMLLEMVPDLPECAADFLTWQPLTYAEHFTASQFRARDLAIASYEAADPALRARFDAVTAQMTGILLAVGAAMQSVRHDRSRAALAVEAAGWVKPLVMRAGSLINGDAAADAAAADVERIMGR